MPEIASGSIVLFYLFDVADAVTLPLVPALVGGGAVANRLTPKSATPPYVQYQQPPFVIDGDAFGHPTVAGFDVRAKVFDYGVVSVALARPFAGSWDELAASGRGVIENERLLADAEAACRALLKHLAPALVAPRPDYVAEDYVVFTIGALEQPLAADALVDRHGDDIARLLRGEAQPLSRQERDEVLRHRLSYLADDLVIPTWNAALVHDTADGIAGALDILEFANSQLLEFRYYDGLLDVEMARIYAELQRERPVALLRSRRYTRAAHAVHALLIDVHELTDHAENALKFVGDVYAARLFSLSAARLGLDRWKASVQEKLTTLEIIYRFAVEQTSIARGEFLELTIILLIVLEVVLVVSGVLK
jgi:hypothetical protein